MPWNLSRRFRAFSFADFSGEYAFYFFYRNRDRTSSTKPNATFLRQTHDCLASKSFGNVSISASKSVLTNVGGKSRVVAIHRHKSMGVANPGEIRGSEKLFDVLASDWEFVLDVVDLRTDEDEFERKLENFVSRVKQSRAQFKVDSQKWIGLFESLGKIE